MGEIILLTGELQSGKTNLCLEINLMAQKARVRVGGVLSPAVFVRDTKTAIDALDLKSGVRKRLAELRASQATGLETQRWSFYPETVEWGNKKLSEAVPCDLLMIDELGPLEFQRGEGWVNGFSAVDSGDFQAAILVIRPSLVETAASRWNVSRVIDLNQTTLDTELIAEILDSFDLS